MVFVYAYRENMYTFDYVFKHTLRYALKSFKAMGISTENQTVCIYGNTCIDGGRKITLYFRLLAFQLSRLFMKH